MASVAKGMFGGDAALGHDRDRRARSAPRVIVARRDAQGAQRAVPRAGARRLRSASTCRSSCPCRSSSAASSRISSSAKPARRPRRRRARARCTARGVLFAAGLITGEALMGIVIAIPIVASGRADVLALPERHAARRVAGNGSASRCSPASPRCSIAPRARGDRARRPMKRLESKLPAVGTTIFTVMTQLANEHGAVNLSQGFPNFEPPDRASSSASSTISRRAAISTRRCRARSPLRAAIAGQARRALRRDARARTPRSRSRAARPRRSSARSRPSCAATTR